MTLKQIDIRRPIRDDLHKITAFLSHYDEKVMGEAETTENDVQSMWDQADMSKDCWIAFRDGHVVGYAGISGSNGVYPSMVVVGPDFRHQGIEDELVELVSKRVQEKKQSENMNEVTLVFQANDEYEQKQLERLQFMPVRYWFRMSKELNHYTDIHFPEGIVIRPYQLGVDDQQLHQAFEESFGDHWGYRSSTLEQFMKRTERVGFNSNNWLLAVDGDKVAGFIFLSYMADQKGEISHLGVRRHWRGKGLAKFLLNTAFNRFFQENHPEVFLSVDSHSLTGATRVYEAAGMHVKSRFIRYDKSI